MTKQSNHMLSTICKKITSFLLSPEVVFGFWALGNVTKNDMNTLNEIEKNREA